MSPSVSKSVHGPFEKNTWESSLPLSHSATTSSGFHSQKLWGLLFPELEPWPQVPDVELGPLAPQEGPL